MAKKKTKSSGSYVGSKSISKSERISGGRKVSRLSVDTRGNTRESVSFIMDAPKEAVRNSFKSSAGGRGLRWIGNNPFGLLKTILLVAIFVQLVLSNVLGSGYSNISFVKHYPNNYDLVYFDVFGYLRNILQYSWNPFVYFNFFSEFAESFVFGEDVVDNIFKAFKIFLNLNSMVLNLFFAVSKTIFVLPMQALLAILGFTADNSFSVFLKVFSEFHIPFI